MNKTKTNSSKRGSHSKAEKEPSINAQVRLVRMLGEPKRKRKATSAAHAAIPTLPMSDAVAAAVVEGARAAAIRAERERVTVLARVSSQAAKLGVSFDLAKAIETGVQPQAARTQVLEAAAQRDEANPIMTMPSVASTAEANTKHTVQAGYDRAIARQRQK